jgi:hypothetical protein
MPILYVFFRLLSFLLFILIKKDRILIGQLRMPIQVRQNHADPCGFPVPQHGLKGIESVVAVKKLKA